MNLLPDSGFPSGSYDASKSGNFLPHERVGDGGGSCSDERIDGIVCGIKFRGPLERCIWKWFSRTERLRASVGRPRSCSGDQCETAINTAQFTIMCSEKNPGGILDARKETGKRVYSQ